MRSASELATRISRALISASNNFKPTRTWNPSLEHTLHRLGCRDSLSPSIVAQIIDPYLLTHHSLALGFFNWAAQQPGFTHDSFSYNSIFKSLSASRQFKAIDALLKQAKSHRVTLDTSVYQFIIGSLIISKKTQNAFWVFNEARQLSREIGFEVCNSLLAALASDGYLDNARKVFDEMISRSISLNTTGFGVFVWRICRNAELFEVLRMIDEVKNSNSDVNGSIVALLIIHGLCQTSRESEALWVLDELRNRQFKPDFMAYRIVSEAFLSTGCVFERETTLKKKRKLGVAPRSNDYREFILALISCRRIIEAKEIGEVIVRGNFPIDEDVLNALIGSVSTIDPTITIEFLNFMIQKGQSPTLLTLSNLSRNLCKHNKTDELLEVYKVLSCNDYFSDIESYNVMISFLCKAGKLREAYAALHEMKKKGYNIDVSLYNSLMEACCREDLLRPAKRLWDEMFSSGCNGNLKTYNILIKKLSEEGELDEALTLFHHMFEKGVEPDALTYTSLFKELCQKPKLEDAFKVFDKCIEQDVMLSRSLLSTFVLQLCRNGHYLVASKWLCDLTTDIGHLDSHVVLLKCSADANESHMGIEHMKLVKEKLPSMLQDIVSELSASLSSSSSAPESILMLLQKSQDFLLQR